MPHLDYVICDVFTETAYGGNPLAVVFDAEGLSTGAMQTLAREFNLSETVFVLPPENAAHSARFRIFTPACELPFAGHPTVGGAVALINRRGKQPLASAPPNGIDQVLMIEEGAGDIRCMVRTAAGEGADGLQYGFAEFDLPRLAEPLAATLSHEAVAEALTISPSKVGFENHRVGVWSAGLPYTLIPLHDLATVEECRLDQARWDAIMPVHAGLLADAYVYCRGGRDHRAHFHARMFAPRMGIAEDPATGSAAAALSGAIAVYDGLLDGHHALRIEQGVEMGRPSAIHVKMDLAEGKLTRARIAGHAVTVASGRIAEPSA